jgi:GDP-L-fucose synthase
MPTNLYGPGDNYHPENSHVIPAMIRRFHEAKLANAPEVAIWGTGTPKREFLYNEDMADACVYLMNLSPEQYQPLLAADRNDGLPPVINIGVGEDVTIRELAELVRETIGYQGVITQDTTKPDGTPRKLMDVTRLSELGMSSRTSLKDGLKISYQSFLMECQG